MTNNAIQLDEEETLEIQKMLSENEKQLPTKKTEEQIKVEQASKEAFKELKRTLKARSKTELIELIWHYGIQLQQMQHISQILLEENKELKGIE